LSGSPKRAISHTEAAYGIHLKGSKKTTPEFIQQFKHGVNTGIDSSGDPMTRAELEANRMSDPLPEGHQIKKTNAPAADGSITVKQAHIHKSSEPKIAIDYAARGLSDLPSSE
jgi:hypothetical protein